MLVEILRAHRAIVFQLLAAHGVGQFGGEYPGGHGDDRVTDDHHQRREHLPDRRLWHDIAEADGVARVSTGPFTQRVALTALQDAVTELLAGGTLPDGTRALN